MQDHGLEEHVNTLLPGAYIIEIGLNTWLDVSWWQYKKNTSHDPHRFFCSLLKHINPCYPYLNDSVDELPYMFKVYDFIKSILSQKKQTVKEQGRSVRLTLLTFSINFPLLSEKNLILMSFKSLPDTCVTGFILLLLKPTSSISYLPLYPNFITPSHLFLFIYKYHKSLL